MSRGHWLALGAALLVTSCGGGGGASTPVVTPPPVAAITRAEAARFLRQASFGPTESEIDRVIRSGYAQWIDEQIAIAPTPQVSGLAASAATPTQANRLEVWFRSAVTGPDQLRQRMVYALSQILVISERSALFDQPFAIAGYQDMLARNAFGSFRTLLQDVTLHPAMGRYLSMLGNEKADVVRNIRPDENYAREVLQLFSIGLVELNSDGSVRRDAQGVPLATYDQPVVENFARVFTGWNFAGSPAWYQPSFDHQRPMQAFAAFHDSGAKTLLRGAAVPAGQTPEKDLADALDNVFSHPNVAPFISKQLIQRFVTSNPSPAYVARVAGRFENNGAGVRGDLAAVIRAILLDSEARTPPATATGKLVEPVIRLTSLWRAFDARAANGRYAIDYADFALGQAPFRSPSVFNFYRPDYAPAGEMRSAGLVAPELAITTEITAALTANIFAVYSFVYTSAATNLAPGDIYLDIAALQNSAGDAATLVTRVAERLLGGGISSALRAEVVAAVERIPAASSAARVGEAIYAIVTSPEFATQI